MNDILIRGGHVLTMDATLGEAAEADVLIRDGRILEVGRALPARGAEIVEAAGRIVLPGFVDGHRHAWQSLLHGLATDWSFPTYMRLARAGYSGCFDAEDAYLASYLGGLEALSAGITSVVDHSHLQTSVEISEALARGSWDSGIGGYFAYAFQNSPDWLGGGYDADALNDLLTRAPDSWHDEGYRTVRRTLAALDDTGSGRLKLGAALPETAPYLPLEVVRPILERIRALDPAVITSHWNAATHGTQYVSSLGALVDEGFFAGATVLAHCNQLNDADLAIMATANIGLATTPGTESGMGLGPLMARRLAEHGGHAALGIDTTYYTGSDLLGQARTLLEAERRDAAAGSGSVPQDLVWSARGALRMATVDGARAVGLGDEVGSLTPGKRADVVVVAPDAVRAGPVVDPAATVLAYTGPADIDTVLVGGEFRKRGGSLVDVDTADLIQRCARSTAAVHSRFAALPTTVIDNAWRGMF
ncbi:amidohydrolase family protein [Amycolatopsis ultiminotia]|uniref:Amidohydrolase family protein n=1 Tax=Amycolatopsis ultiminotia TaxID=543629 RepID=A0ABP6V2T4_9PSEU